MHVVAIRFRNYKVVLQAEHYESKSPPEQVWHVRWHWGQNKRAPSSYHPALQMHWLEETVIALLLTVGA